MSRLLVALPWIAIALVAAPPAAPRLTPSSAESSTAHGDSYAPTFSASGRFLVFVSTAKDLVTNGVASAMLDIFRHDLESGRTELVTVSTNPLFAANGESRLPGISSNGQFVVFSSDASNLVGGDTNRVSDVFLRDMDAQSTFPISVNTNGTTLARLGSGTPAISADGRRILFDTESPDVFPNVTNTTWLDLGLRDWTAGTNLLISMNSDGTASGLGPYPGAGSFGDAALTDNARFVAFMSTATNLIANTATTNAGIFVRDTELGVTRCASADIQRTVNVGTPFTISAEGTAVLFTSYEALSNRSVYRYDIASQETSLLASNVIPTSTLSLSTDGRYAVIATDKELSLHDTLNETSKLICGSGAAPEIVGWRCPMISGNAQRVTFAGRTNAAGPWYAYAFTTANGAHEIVSLSSNGEPVEIGAMSEPVISRDGRHIAYESRAANIALADLNNATDIFVRNLESNTTQLVSRRVAAHGTPPLGALLEARSAADFGNIFAFSSHDRALDMTHDNSWRSLFIHDRRSGTNRALSSIESRSLGTNRLAFNPVLSANGRYVAWLEQALLPTGETGAATNIFWLDLLTGASRSVLCNPVTFARRSVQGSGSVSSYAVAIPSLSPDGRWLAFAERIPGNAYLQVFRRDMFNPSSTNELLSDNLVAGGPATGDSFGPQLTPDARWIVFFSRALNAITNNGFIFPDAQLIARNMETGERHWVNTDSNGDLLRYGTSYVISGNSRYVFFRTGPSFPPVAHIYRHDLKTRSGTNVLVATNALEFSVSEDGNTVAYRDAVNDIRVHDIYSGTTTLASSNVLTCCSGGNGISFAPVVSSNARYVVFASAATNLVGDDTNRSVDLFVHDRSAGSTILVSRNASGAPGAGSSSIPVLAADGRTILFSSSATDLISTDFNNARDIFVLRLGSKDSDFDQMDDEWELAYFNTLSRDGREDLDGDGASDRHEFDAATDPTNGGSVFRVLTVDRNGNDRLVLWNAIPGRNYRLEYKDSAADLYWEQIAKVTASNATASYVDRESAASRIYRVVLLP